jgi:hypothetical protein
LKEIKFISKMIGHSSKLTRILYIKVSKNSYLVRKNLRKISLITRKSRTRGNKI